jgi:hypothetical protein
MSERQQCADAALEALQAFNAGNPEPAHNFIEIAHEMKDCGEKEAAAYYYEFNAQNNDAKHFNDVHFDNVTNQAKK